MEYNQLRYDRSYSVRQFPVLHFPRMGVRVGTTRHQGDRITAGTHIHVGTRLGFLSVDIESRCARHVNNHTASSPRVDNYRRLHGNCVRTTGIPQTPREIHRNARMPRAMGFVYNARLSALTVILIIISFESSTLSFIPDLKPSYSANPSYCSLSFSSSGLTTWIPQTFTVTSEHSISVFTFQVFFSVFYTF